jgi:hypothetical protein
MYVMSVLYASCQLLIMYVFDLPTYDEFVFDANDLTVAFYSVLPILPITLSWFTSKRAFEEKRARMIYIALSSVLIFYIAYLFMTGSMWR